MGKFAMPTVEEFLEKKRIYSKKKDYVWDYIEKDMLENADKKPYNKIVHEWLVYLKELKQYQHKEKIKQVKTLNKEVGPPWFVQLSAYQISILKNLKHYIHQDLLEDIPRRTNKALRDIGLTLKVPKSVLLKTMAKSEEDPGLFMWGLYQAIYKASPSILQSKYDMNARYIMSSIVFIDLDECKAKLEELTHFQKTPVVKKEKKERYFTQPKGELGSYLQTMKAASAKDKPPPKEKKPLPLGNKLKLRSPESYERLKNDENFLEARKERNKQEKEQERVCTYKFWEPPSTLRNTDPKLSAYGEKLKMFKMKAKVKYKCPLKNLQYQIGNVCFTGGKPNYMLTGSVVMPTGYIHIHGGHILIHGCPVPIITGHWRYPIPKEEKCDEPCTCMALWEEAAMKYVKTAKCKCGHLYDFKNEGVPTETYFYPPTKHGKHYIDEAKIYQFDPTEDMIRDAVQEGLRSRSADKISTVPTLSASGLKESELAAAFLADLADTPLLIPHLPLANELINLKAWVRRRVKGPLSPKEIKRAALHSERRWLQLKHVDYRARAFGIPFTKEELENMNWSQRHMLQKLFDRLLDNFVTRNRQKQLVQTRQWWATCKYDDNPNPAFLDIFFTYLPARMQDVYFINPYSSELTPKYGAKTCPLNF